MSIVVPHSAQCSRAGEWPKNRSAPSSKRASRRWHRLACRQGGERFICQIEKFRMRIVLVGQIAQQLGNIVAGIQPGQVPPGGAKPPQKFGLRHQVERFGRFVEEDYSTKGQYVKSRLERVLESSGPLGQGPDLAEFPRKEPNHEARFAEIDRAEDQGAGFFGRHRSGGIQRKSEKLSQNSIPTAVVNQY